MSSLRLYYTPFYDEQTLVGWMITPNSYDYIHKHNIKGPRNMYTLEEVFKFPKSLWKEIHQPYGNDLAYAILLWNSIK